MRKVKRILILFMTILFVSALHAQEEEQSWKLTLPRHDLQFGIGDPALLMLNNENYSWFSHSHSSNETADNWFTNDIYNALTVAIPTVNFEYRYRFAKWFWFGGAISYNAIFSRYEDRITGNVMAKTTNHYIAIMPSVRFSWLNKKYVTLYSGLSLGCGIKIGEKYNPENQHSSVANTNKYTTLDIAGQLTAVGVQVGRNWYGFTEIGIGNQGFIKAGFGYKFNKKENKVK